MVLAEINVGGVRDDWQWAVRATQAEVHACDSPHSAVTHAAAKGGRDAAAVAHPLQVRWHTCDDGATVACTPHVPARIHIGVTSSCVACTQAYGQVSVGWDGWLVTRA